MENTGKKEGVTCPRCFGEMRKVQVQNALSRRDNKTYICSACGTQEALIDAGYEKPTYQERMFVSKLQGKRAALHVVTYDFGNMIAVAVEGESGYYPTGQTTKSRRYDEACREVEVINSRDYGLDKKEAMLIVLSSMRANA